MMKNFLSILLFAAAFSTTLFLTSCSDDLDTEVSSDLSENFVDQSIFSIQAEANAGKFGCFEFVFPINIVFPDGTNTEVSDYETLRSTLKAWFDANKEDLDLPERDGHGRPNADEIPWDQLPTLDFPVEVITDSGETMSIADRQELHDLKKQCRRDFYQNRGHHRHHRGDKCFSIVFPLSIVFPDGMTQEVEDRKALKMTLRTWKKDNPDAEERPMIQFPVTVELEDGTTQSVASKEDLEALKETCSGD
jgi:hypothetical protein